MSTQHAVVLLSGGLDSTTLLWHLSANGCTCDAISFNYGQRHHRELAAAKKVGVGCNRHKFLDCNGLGTDSALTSQGIKLPQGAYSPKTLAVTVVPNRNMVFISHAVSWALQIGANAVAYGAHAGDHAVYPDCRPRFHSAMQAAVEAASDGRVSLLAPFISWSKSDIAREARRLGVPIEDTWSCYAGGNTPCGVCSTCIERQGALHGT